MNRFGPIIILAIFGILLFAGCKPDARGGLDGRVVEFRLANGMKWLFLKRGYAPIFAGVVQVKVGGVDEESGKTGIAHILEHMAFKGTSTIGTKDFAAEKKIMDEIDRKMNEGFDAAIPGLLAKQREYIVSDEIWDIFMRNGANRLNAYTSKDVTTYHAEMPSSKLELWIYLTSEMIFDPSFREYYPERQVILEELRASTDNNPLDHIYAGLLALAFKRSPYSWPTIGIKRDVSSLKSSDIARFYREKYLPECMVGALVGDIDVEAAKKMVDKYFGRLKAKNPVCNQTIAIDPLPSEGRSAEIFFDAEPILLTAFYKPTVPNYDDYIFDVFSSVLCEGEASRMEKALVKEKRIAKRIACFNSYPGTRLDNLFVIYAEPFDAASIGKLKEEIASELGRLKTDPIEKAEFDKVKNQMKVSFLMNLDSNYELSQTLVFFENIAGDWHYIISHPENIDTITAADLMAAASRYFVPKNMVQVVLKRENEKAD